MAVTKKQKITGSLAAATAGLLTSTPGQAADLYNKWKVDLAYYNYSENGSFEEGGNNDFGISVDSWIGKINGNLSDDTIINIGMTLDTLSGVTPTGALPIEGVTYTGASGGGGSGGAGAGATAEFNDTRLAVDASITHDVTRQFRTSVVSYVSVETDYNSIGGSLGFEYDDRGKNNTLSFAIGGATDKIFRTGETTPEPLSAVSDEEMNTAGRKNALEFITGWTRVMNRRTVAQFNYSYSQSLGYHTEPYKVFSAADEEAQPDTELYYESRPDSRIRQVFFTNWRFETGNQNHIGWNYRYYTDDWDIDSHTLNLNYAFTRPNGNVFEPFVRFYTQSAAFFHADRLLIDPGNGISADDALQDVNYLSSDGRLAEMSSYSLGAKYIMKTRRFGDIKIRGGYMDQTFVDAVYEKNRAFFLSFNLFNDFE